MTIKIIEGRRYNTETATELCTYESPPYQTDSHHEIATLYRTAGGRFFIAGYGGPMTRWAQRTQGGLRGGDGLYAIDFEEARHFAELHSNEETIALYFEVEDA